MKFLFTPMLVDASNKKLGIRCHFQYQMCRVCAMSIAISIFREAIHKRFRDNPTSVDVLLKFGVAAINSAVENGNLGPLDNSTASDNTMSVRLKIYEPLLSGFTKPSEISLN